MNMVMASKGFVEGTKYISGEKLGVAVSYSQGHRKYMQDDFEIAIGSKLDHEVDFLGVFDGHDFHGDKVSLYLAQNLNNFVLRQLVAGRFQRVEQIIQTAFIQFDRLLSNHQFLNDGSGQVRGGSTACCIWLRKNMIISANTGDSRAVMSVKGKAVPLTFDHKPTNPFEFLRIKRAGGYVSGKRVQGILALSRAFGDYFFKMNPGLGLAQQMVTALPDVKVTRMSKNLEFIVLGTDGLWDCMTNQEVVNMVWQLIRKKMPLDIIANEVKLRCIAPPNSSSPIGKDNVTVMIAVVK